VGTEGIKTKRQRVGTDEINKQQRGWDKHEEVKRGQGSNEHKTVTGGHL